MKLNVKLLYIIMMFNFLRIDLYAYNIEASDNINGATIKPDISSSTYNSLPKNEVIDTIFEDPLSESFMGKGSDSLNKERNRSTSDLVSEFEGQAKEINDNTEIPDNIADKISKEDREKIEARADQLLKEAAIKESNENSGKSLLEKNDSKTTEKIVKEIDNSVSLNENTEVKQTEQIDNNSLAVDDQITDSYEDPEFLESSRNGFENNESVEIIMVNEQDNSDDIPDYSKLQGIIIDKSHSHETSKTKVDSKSNKHKKKNKSKLKKKFLALDPMLIIDGQPKTDDVENNKVYTFIGILIPEKQPLSKRKSMLRWVLELNDGQKIPLKSNLKLLQEVRKITNLEDFVSVSGKMRTSSFDKNLKYLIPETIVKSNKKDSSVDTTNSNEKDVTVNTNKTIEVKSGNDEKESVKENNLTNIAKEVKDSNDSKKAEEVKSNADNEKMKEDKQSNEEIVKDEIKEKSNDLKDEEISETNDKVVKKEEKKVLKGKNGILENLLQKGLNKVTPFVAND